jgi:tetratricopeptide (TPR) repeat protein
LARGDADGAIAVLERAHEAGPQFADALELWGEALMHKAAYRAAISKFRAADDAAPRWGANHLHWGESLLRTGSERQAKVQFDRARLLSLSASDRAELDASSVQAPPERHR